MKRYFKSLKSICLSIFALTGANVAHAADLFTRLGPIKLGDTVSKVVWVDGEQGMLHLANGAIVRFRLAGVDAPEAVSPDADGLKAWCHTEYAMGLDAKSFMQSRTSDGAVEISYIGPWIRYDMVLLALTVSGEDIAKLGLDAGHLRVSESDEDLSDGFTSDWCQNSKHQRTVMVMK